MAQQYVFYNGSKKIHVCVYELRCDKGFSVVISVRIMPWLSGEPYFPGVRGGR